jgi:ParB family chromosome partitioning protein
MAGRRLNLASLAGEAVETTPGSSKPTLVHLPPEQVAATPLNPRQDFDPAGLEELGNSMRAGQLQPCVAVTRAAYIKLFPEHADQLPDCRLVMAAGERRWRAAQKVGLPTLDVHVREDLAESRTRFLSAVLTENVERANFNPIEEARGLQRMLEMTGGQQTEAAAQLGKSKQWFNQRIGLLRLTDDMQQLVVSGKLTAFRDMRRYSALPAAEQMAAWKADQAAAEQKALEPKKPSQPRQQEPPSEVREEPGYTAVYPQPSKEAGAEPSIASAVPPAQNESGVTTAHQPSTVAADEPAAVGLPEASEQRAPVSLLEPRHEAPKDATPAPPVAAVPDPRPEPEKKGPTYMPWTDGAASMDIMFRQLLLPERDRAIARYLELLGGPDEFARQLAGTVNPEYRQRLAQLLFDNA